MRNEDLVLVTTADLVGQVRGRAFSSEQLEHRLGSGVGWVPANLAISAFGELEEPNVFGSTGDLRLRPDTSASIQLEGAEGHSGFQVLLADIVNTDLTPWSSCPRDSLKRVLTALKEEFGLTMHSSFEHEFTLLDQDWTPMPRGGPSFSVAALQYYEPFGSRLWSSLAGAGFEPDTWLAEFGPNQFEITLVPAEGIVAADRAILLREVVRDLARRQGMRASFSPLVSPHAIGNGVHVHFSFRDESGRPVLFDASRPAQLSEVGGSFAGGILRHAKAVCALTAPSVVSYLRMRPHTWSAGRAVLGLRNREAMLRICPTVGTDRIDHQYNLEFRAADATANSWLVLTAILASGLDGLRRGLDTPHIMMDDIDVLSADEIAASEIETIPTSLTEAIDAFEAEPMFAEWLSSDLRTTYRALKQREVSTLYGATAAEICHTYANLY